MRSYILSVGLAVIASTSFAYTNSFTLDFNTVDAGEADWTEPSGGSVQIGETVPPAGPFAPQSAAGANGTGWLRGVTPQAAGVFQAVYNGAAGGSNADVTNFTLECDVFIAPASATRYQSGLLISWDASDGFNGFEFFYSRNTNNQPDGYGFRGVGDGVTTTYAMFSGLTETGDRWVRLRAQVNGATANLSVDRDLNGTYDLTESNVAFDGVAGKPGLFAVINDPATFAAMPDQYGYYDNFKYTNTSAVSDWQMY